MLRPRPHVEEPAAVDVEVLVPAWRLVGLLPAVTRNLFDLGVVPRLHALSVLTR